MLKGYRILDLADEKGSYCGRILGDLGADVIKVERPSGDPARRIGPFYHDIPDPERSLHWLAFNSSKRGITLNIEGREGRTIFRKLSEKADIVVESFPPGYLDKLGLSYADLSSLNPGIIMVSITPFGQTGPYRDRKASDIAILAMSGLMSITGDADRAPVRMCLDQTYSLGATHGLVGALIALRYRRLSHVGQHVDVSLYEAAVRGNYWEPARWEFLKEIVKRSGNRFPRAVAKGLQLWPCKDGYVTWLLTGGVTGAKQMNALVQWMDEKNQGDTLKAVDWDALHLSEVSPEQMAAWEAIIGKFFLRFTMKEMMAEAIKRGIPMAGVNRIDQVAEDEQLAYRGYWERLPMSGLEETVGLPAFAYLSGVGSTRIRNRAPRIGEHNEEVYIKELGFSGDDIASFRKQGIL
ncbi:MAG: CoA transferase [Syntrophorhabdales bacterium]|jgi:crotonobetainyl-CoA:carnitine CoA-transferase CaiB-like acyl-CoA transferase